MAQNKAESLRVQLAERVQEVGQLREALAAAEGELLNTICLFPT